MNNYQQITVTLNQAIYRLIFLCAMLTSLSLISSTALAKPIGYERYSLTGIKSDVFFERDEKEVYAYWAKPLSLTGSSGGVTAKRLIDIEVHVTGKKGKQKAEYSGVWIQNTGYFEQESWLQTGVGFVELFAMANAYAMDLIPLDIERYKLNGTQLFAIIWQRNIHKSHWYLKIEVSSQDIRIEEDNGFRVVDFDHFIKIQEGSLVVPLIEKFDAIMVQNSGANYLNYEWVALLPVKYEHVPFGPSFSWDFHFPVGSTAVDVENVNWPYEDDNWPWNGHGYAIIIHNVGACDFSLSNTSGPLGENVMQDTAQPQFGRILDIEGGYNPYEGWHATGYAFWHALHGCNYADDGS